MKFKQVFVVAFRTPIKWASTSLFGENHSLTHRCIVGVGIMIVGVNIAHTAEFITIAFIKLSLDGVGYLIHGIGAVPFVDLLHKISTKAIGEEEKVEHDVSEIETHTQSKTEEYEKAEH